MTSKPKTVIDKVFRDKHGKLTLGQMPNAPIIAWAVFSILSIVVKTGKLHRGFDTLSSAFLFTWAYLELTAGDSIFRRVLGATVLVVTAAGFFA
jgi:hypothetical protein